MGSDTEGVGVEQTVIQKNVRESGVAARPPNIERGGDRGARWQHDNLCGGLWFHRLVVPSYAPRWCKVLSINSPRQHGVALCKRGTGWADFFTTCFQQRRRHKKARDIQQDSGLRGHTRPFRNICVGWRARPRRRAATVHWGRLARNMRHAIISPLHIVNATGAGLRLPAGIRTSARKRS